jgi:CHASE3 domain sensor protein
MNWLYNMKIGTRLIAAFIFLGAITAAVGYVGVRSLGQVADQAAASYANETLGVAYLEQINIDLKQAARSEKNILLSSTVEQREKYRARTEASLAKIGDDIEKARPLIRAEAGKALLGQLDQAWKERQVVAQQIIDLAMQDKLEPKRPSVDLAFGDGGTKTDTMSDVLDKMTGVKLDTAKQGANDTDESYRSSRTVMIGLIFGGILAGLGLGVFISRSISKPLAQLSEAARFISLGDVNQNISYHAGDEVGLLDAGRDPAADRRRQPHPGADLGGKIDELIAQTYKGDHEKMKQAVNNVAVVVQSLQKEMGRLTDASKEGQLSERGKPEQFQGAYAEIVRGVNDHAGCDSAADRRRQPHPGADLERQDRRADRADLQGRPRKDEAGGQQHSGRGAEPAERRWRG